MKLNLDEQICSKTLTLLVVATSLMRLRWGQLLVIDGIRRSFASDFITITRESNADWQPI